MRTSECIADAWEAEKLDAIEDLVGYVTRIVGEEIAQGNQDVADSVNQLRSVGYEPAERERIDEIERILVRHWERRPDDLERCHAIDRIRWIRREGRE